MRILPGRMSAMNSSIAASSSASTLPRPASISAAASPPAGFARRVDCCGWKGSIAKWPTVECLLTLTRLLKRRETTPSSSASSFASPPQHLRFSLSAHPSSVSAAVATPVVTRHSARSQPGSSGSSSSSAMSSKPTGTKKAMMTPFDTRLQCAQPSSTRQGLQKPPCMVYPSRQTAHSVLLCPSAQLPDCCDWRRRRPEAAPCAAASSGRQ